MTMLRFKKPAGAVVTLNISWLVSNEFKQVLFGVISLSVSLLIWRDQSICQFTFFASLIDKAGYYAYSAQPKQGDNNGSQIDRAWLCSKDGYVLLSTTCKRGILMVCRTSFMNE